MNIKPLNQDFAVSPQIALADIPAIIAQGLCIHRQRTGHQPREGGQCCVGQHVEHVYRKNER